MPDKLIGRFYFRKTECGNLIGEYSNSFATKNVTESAVIDGDQNGFIGNYRTCWLEDEEPIFSRLEIIFKPQSDNKIYLLKWLDAKQNPIYWCEGFLCESILIGDYRNFQNP